MFDIKSLAAVQIGLASPDEIRSWSHGEVTKSETLNYRSQKPEMGGLLCERIFGPAKDYECHCGKYKKIRYQGIKCEKCGVEVISKEFRRERMGHIELVSPCTHIWYLKGTPSRMALILEIPAKQLEEIVYFAAHICLNPGQSHVLYYKEYLDERTARTVFIDAINEFKGNLEENSSDALKAQHFIEQMQNPAEAFQFDQYAAFISKYTGAEFGQGAAAVKQLLQEINLRDERADLEHRMAAAKPADRAKLAKKLEVVEAFIESNQKPEWMVLDVIPVIPPDLRPLMMLDGGRSANSDLNELYRRVISRNNRLKKLIEMSAPGPILTNEKRMLQEAVDALINNGRRTKPVTGPSGRALKSLSDVLKGKQGRFRQNLLGKRVDYSGRSVIAVGPDLRMYQCGIPREMAIALLRPFIAAILIRDGYCNAHRAADKLIDRRDPIVSDIVEKIISQHPVLLNRAPTLHRLSVQAFQPKLVEGRAIRLHPLVCPGFNADFDGDQMAVHVPLGKAAQYEALELMLASNNILGPKDGKPVCIPSQDMVLGNYYLTVEESKQDFLDRAEENEAVAKFDGVNAEADLAQAAQDRHYAEMEGKVFSSVNEVIKAYETKTIALHNRIALPAERINKIFGEGIPEDARGKYLITTVGKVIFNQIFPDDFPWINEINAENRDDFAKGLEQYFVPRGTDIPAYIAKQPLHQPVKKNDLTPIIAQVFRKYGTQKTSAVLDKLKDQGFQYSMVSSVTIAISDIKPIPGKYEKVAESQKKVDEINKIYRKGYLSNDERHQKVVAVWMNCTADVKKDIQSSLQKDKRNPIVIMSDSGARGSLSNIAQLIGMKGLVANPKNETIELPIVSSYREGMKVSEFFINTHGARKGSADTALKTADSGYLTRRLVDVSQDVIVREEDCHCDHGFKVREIRNTAQNAVVVPLKDRLYGRFAMHDVVNPATGEVIVPGNTMISEAQAQAIVDAGIKEVEIRSLFTCQTKDGVCQHCYGLCMATGKLINVGDAVGIMAAQSIGEPGTQLTLRVFHTGGTAGSDITTGLPRVVELVEARNPKGVALISDIDGLVTDVHTDDDPKSKTKGCSVVTVVTARKNETEKGVVYSVKEEGDPGYESKEYTCPYGARLRVKVGDHVEAGAKITEGAVDPKHLLEVSDVEKVEVYLLKEIQKVYRATDIAISDKHLEVVIRQMLRRMVVGDPGDTPLLPGAVVDREKFTEVNQKALLNHQRPAVGAPIVLGITKAALQSDSFLSAASFQETTRILTDAAIKAKRDPLHGLKENVIAGKLIPAGTGLWSEEHLKEVLKDWSVEKKMKEVRASYIEAHDRPEDE